MRKKQIIWGVALVALVIGANLCEAAGLSFKAMKPVQSEAEMMEWNDDYREALEKAMDVHNLMIEVRRMREVERQLNVTKQMRELEEKRLAALEKCSIEKLGEQFKNPKEVWDKMNAEYAKKEKELTIYVNATKEPTEEEQQAFLDYFQTGVMTPDMVAEQYAPWRIGQEILTDVCQNQDKWGERKDVKAPSFPLWKDQKYTFDQDWNAYYTKLNAYFGAPSEGRPVVGDEKYDYAKYEDVQKAHADYVAKLGSKKPAKGAALDVDLKNPPKAPKPLPPKSEMVVYFETDTPEASVYPELPEPWQKYAEKGFKEMDPNGEMAADFKEGLVLKEQAKNGPNANRLTAYARHKQSVDGMQSIEKVGNLGGDSALGKAYDKLGKYIQLESGDNLLDEKSREKILARLKAKKKELVEAAEKELLTRPEDKEEMVPTISLEDIEDFEELKKLNPDVFAKLKIDMPMSVYERDENILKALKKDTEGRVLINEINAGDVDQLLKEEEARRAFVEGQDDIEKMVAAGASLKIDETCLNGGV